MKPLNFKYLLLSVFFALIVINSYSQKNETTKIKGKISNNIFKTVYLFEFGQSISKIDSATVSKNGDFMMKSAIKQVAIYQLKLNDTNKLMLVLKPGQNINITADAKNLIGSINISGSPDSKLIYDTQREIQIIFRKIDSLNNVFIQNKDKADVNNLIPVLQAEYNKLVAEQRTFVTTTILGNINSLACLFFIDKLDFTKDIDIYSKLDSALYLQYPENVFVKELHKKVGDALRLAIGHIAPEINLPDTTGINKIALSSLKGKIVLIDFWASWCGPCKKEYPFMRKIHKKYKNYDFVIYAVSLDKSKDSWTGSIKKDSLNWIHVSDLNYWQSEAALVYEVKGIPYTYLLDREGKIIAKGLRGDALDAKLEEIFGLKK